MMVETQRSLHQFRIDHNSLRNIHHTNNQQVHVTLLRNFVAEL